MLLYHFPQGDRIRCAAAAGMQHEHFRMLLLYGSVVHDVFYERLSCRHIGAHIIRMQIVRLYVVVFQRPGAFHQRSPRERASCAVGSEHQAAACRFRKDLAVAVEYHASYRTVERILVKTQILHHAVPVQVYSGLPQRQREQYPFVRQIRVFQLFDSRQPFI